MIQHHTRRRLSRVLTVLAAALLTGAAPAQTLTQEAQTQDSNRLSDRKGEFGRFQGPVPPLDVLDDGLALGDIEPGSEHVRTVQLCNRGDVPVVIERTSSDCDCTTMEPETRVIPPGECIPFTVVYHANQNIAPLHRKVFIFCEGFPNPFIAHVTGEVTYAVKINQHGLRAINTVTGQITLDSIDGKPFTVLAMNGEPPAYIGFDPASHAPRSSYVVHYDWSSVPAADLPRWMIIETDHPDAPMMDLRVIIPTMLAESEPLMNPKSKFRPIEDRLLLPELKPGEGHEIAVTIKGVGRGTADAVAFKVESDALDVEFVDRDSEPKSGTMVYRLRVTPRPEASGFEHAILRVTMGDQTCGLDLFARIHDADAVSHK